MRRAMRKLLTPVPTIGPDVHQLIDEAWYRQTYPEVAGSKLSAKDHFLNRGWAEGRNPNSLFNTEWYFAQYPDVEHGGINPLVHFCISGWREGRQPNQLFDTIWYLEQNPDVAAAEVNPLAHYMNAGWKEGRKPNPLFDGKWYALTHGLPRDVEPLGHYIEEGAPTGLAPAALFDGNWYLEQNPDVAAAGRNPLEHYLASGGAEQRNPHPLFDARWYSKQYELTDSAVSNPLAHYVEIGRKEGRNPNPWFDTAWYLETYPDVAAAGIDALQHFLGPGGDERRRAGPNFHTDFYVEQYPDAGEIGINPLRHFIETGRARGYAPTAIHASGNSSASVTEREPKNPTLATPQINMRAGEIVEPPLDALGTAAHPRYRRGDGRRIAALRQHRDHHWYEGEALSDFLATVDDKPLLPGIRRLLVIGHDFAMKTGVMRSLAHYLNAVLHVGGIELTSIEIAPGGDAMSALHDVETHDFVIVNSLPLFFSCENGIELLRRAGAGKSAVYLHETDFVIDKLERTQPEKFRAFADAAKEFAFMTVSAQQEAMLRSRFGVDCMKRVHETSPMALAEAPAVRRTLSPEESLTIVMAGTLQPRKGVTLFSEVADRAKAAGLPWAFRWAGGEVGMSEGLYRSENVDFVGNLDGAQMKEFMSSADVFFLSSEDDPFPLACVEALQLHKRVVAFRKTGTSEVLRDVGGCAVFDAHDASSAFDALKKAVRTELDLDACDALNQRFSLQGFVAGMNSAIRDLHEQKTPDVAASGAAALKTSALKTAVIVHLFYHDLWDEIAGYLENCRHINPDLYVTLTSDKPAEERDAMRARILNRWPDATIIETPNQGMDVGPFVEVARYITEKGLDYDLLLKLHSKKSITASGEAHGSEWRKKLFQRLAGTPTDVDRILSIFADHPEFGMVGPSGMRKEMTTADIKAGRVLNSDNMKLIADKLGLNTIKQDFFVGTMFWGKAAPIINKIAGSTLRVADFEPGHQPDNSKAHAMERLFADIVREYGSHLYDYDPDLPKSIRLLKNRHVGEDIYIIAAGASAGEIDPTFFENKTVIGVNRVFARFDCDYIIFKEFGGLDYEVDLLKTKAIPITSKWDSGNIRQGKMRPNLMSFKRPEYYFFDHLENTREIVDTSVMTKDSDRLVVSYSTITSSMHLAAYMGAKNIILVGHDCGLLDGKSTFDGYYKDMTISPWSRSEEYVDWLSRIEAQSLLVKETLKSRFRVNVHSLNPFINFNLEGRQFTSGPEAAQTIPTSRRSLPVLLLCNGPSAAGLALKNDKNKYLIARMNFFFLEEKPFANGRVDYLFWAANEPNFHQELFDVVRQNRYSIDLFCTCIAFEDLRYPIGHVAEKPFLDPEKIFNHWKSTARFAKLALLQMKRPLPTTGLQALAGLAAAGHRKFAIAGMDFYQDSNVRYHYQVPDTLKQVLAPKHLKPGYEKNAHTLSADLEFLEAIVQEFPDLEFELLSDQPVLREALHKCGARILN